MIGKKRDNGLASGNGLYYEQKKISPVEISKREKQEGSGKSGTAQRR